MNKFKSQLKMLQERGPWKYCHFLILKSAKYLQIGFYFPTLAAKDIDIVYVVHTKDASTLEKSIASLKFIKNINIKNIYVITNDPISIGLIIKDSHITLVNENDVVSFNVNHYPYPPDSDKKGSRNGWLYQQFLKLGWALHSTSENYIVIDSDTYFIRPVSFFGTQGKFIFFGTEEWWTPYFQAFSFLFNERSPAFWSRTAHMMIFNKKNVLEMMSELERLHHSPWHEAIAKTRSINSHACFSEYETYANWMLLRHPDQCEVRPSFNTNASNPKLKISDAGFNSISNHSYL